MPPLKCLSSRVGVCRELGQLGDKIWQRANGNRLEMPLEMLKTLGMEFARFALAVAERAQAAANLCGDLK